MADRYWVGGTGTWNFSDTSHWSASSGGSAGASAPTTSDAAIFDASSGDGGGSGTVTLSAPSCASVDFTGSTCTVTGVLQQCYGNVTLASGGTYTSLTIWPGILGSGTVTSNGNTIAKLVVSTTITCADALSATEIDIRNGSTLKLKESVTSSVSTFTTPSSGANGVLTSGSAGTRATLSDSSGTNSVTYLSIKDIAFTGGATWNADTTCVDNGNNTGITFATASASFDALFAQSLA